MSDRIDMLTHIVVESLLEKNATNDEILLIACALSEELSTLIIEDCECLLKYHPELHEKITPDGVIAFHEYRKLSREIGINISRFMDDFENSKLLKEKNKAKYQGKIQLKKESGTLIPKK